MVSRDRALSPGPCEQSQPWHSQMRGYLPSGYVIIANFFESDRCQGQGLAL